MDRAVLGFTVLVCVLTGMAFSLVPLLQVQLPASGSW